MTKEQKIRDNSEEKVKKLLKEIKILKEKNEKLKSRKKYGIVWEEEKEPEKVVLECKEKIPILKDIKDKEILTDENKPMNILIEGDNYHALQVLNYTHKGKIDVIYIDPPYNTGAKDWKYNNDYVDINDYWRHSKWLSFMHHRLVLAKEILSDMGVFICTIDHNEQEALGLILKDLFYDKEITCVTIVHNPSGIQGKNFSYTHEYAYFVYRGDKKVIGFEQRDDKTADVRNFMNTAKGKSRNYLRESGVNCFYPIYVKDYKILGFGNVCDESFHPISPNICKKDGYVEVYPIDSDGVERKWVFSRKNVESIIDELSVRFDERTKLINIIRTKKKINYKTVWIDKKFSAKTYGTQLLSKIIGKEFPFPKSLYNVKECLDAVAKNNRKAVILDFFAGSGTTGHAVMEMNKADNGNRKFILCTNNEGNICTEVCYPRIEKVIKGYPFKGRDKTLLYEKKLTASQIGRFDEIKKEVEEIKKEAKYSKIQNTLHSNKENKNKFDKIQTTIKDNKILIYGIKEINDKKEGLGGNLKYFKTDFIDVGDIYTISDEKKIELTYKAGEMIAIREDAFKEVEKNEWWQIFKNKNKTVSVYFREDQSKLEKLFEKNKNTRAIVYLFSWGKNELKAQEYGYDNIEIKDIPQPIIEVYKEINSL